jgi:hypothetical protein
VTSVEDVHLSGVLAEYGITTNLLRHDTCLRSKDVRGLTTETTTVEVGNGVNFVECHAKGISNGGFV